MLAGLCVVIAPAPAFACSCRGFTAAEAFDVADAVFAGTVVEVEEPAWAPVWSSDDPVTLRFDVEQVYKGQVPVNARLTTARDGASCGADFVVGARYLVHVDTDQGEWTTTLCSGNERLRGAISPGYAPTAAIEDGTGRPWLPWAAGGFVALLAALVTAAALRHRRRPG